MAIQPMALQVQNPQINTVQALGQGIQARQQIDDNQITLARKGLENIGSIALGAMGGKMDGQADPELFEQGLDMLEQNGIKVDAFRGRPDVAPMVARASMTALQQLGVAQDERTYELAMEKFQHELSEAAKPKPSFRTMTPDETSGMGLKGVYQIGPDGKVVEVGGGNASAGPASVQEYSFYADQERAAGREPKTLLEFEQAKKGQGLTVTTNPDGTTTVQQGGPALKLTEQQSKDVGFLAKSNAANATLKTIDSELTNRVSRAAGADPTGLARDWMQSDDFQKAENAALEFKTAILRKDSGAAITPSEDAQYDRLYIPQPGDGAAVIAQKREARARAVDAIEAGLPSAAIAALEEQGLLPRAIEEARGEPDAQPTDQPDVGEGTIIENDAGDRMVLRNGNWEAM